MTEERTETTEPAGPDEPAEHSAPTEPPPTFGSLASALFRRAKAGAQQALDAAEQHRPAAERMARQAIERTQHAVDAARPEVERLARDAVAAAQSAAAFARPVAERIAHDAATYAREHQDEIRTAATRAAGVAANLATQRVVPGPLRPMVDALRQELQGEELPTVPGAPSSELLTEPDPGDRPTPVPPR